MNTVLAQVIEHRGEVARLGWGLLFLVLSADWEPRGAVPHEYSKAISNGCGYVHHHLCVRGGCYYLPRVVERGEPRSQYTSEVLPTFVDLAHQTGYFQTSYVRLSKLEDVRCVQTHGIGESIIMGVLASLIPAMVLCFLIIVALLLLPSNSEPYILGEPVKQEPMEMDQIPPNDRYSIVNPGDGSEIDPNEFDVGDGEASPAHLVERRENSDGDNVEE